jgi:hypothetical protein
LRFLLLILAFHPGVWKDQQCIYETKDSQRSFHFTKMKNHGAFLLVR